MIENEVKLAPELAPEFTPDRRVEIEGATLSNSRVGISVVTPKDGQRTEVWMDLPNAMYLMNLLNRIWIKTRVPVPVRAPNGDQRAPA